MIVKIKLYPSLLFESDCYDSESGVLKSAHEIVFFNIMANTRL